MIIIQHIITHWTQKTRGMPGVEKRKKVPHKLLLPDASHPLPSVLLHEITAYEWEDFRLQQTTKRLDQLEQYWSFQFQQQEHHLEIWFTYSKTEHGSPERGTYLRRIFNLKKNQTAVFQINGRFANEEGQYYVSHFVNLGFVNRFNDNLFLTKAPDHNVDLRAQLY